eukprot:TRINITY_DN43410_c0_g1_i1.p1 TRINITY_DN43410_c0_g1~~TRINITY_DN43410_c0_g1_i1.p1  ORF type:complete len:212 (+),score=29.43 TRINITY_DN43410_c0_g1_i1:55-636(+)
MASSWMALMTLMMCSSCTWAHGRDASGNAEMSQPATAAPPADGMIEVLNASSGLHLKHLRGSSPRGCLCIFDIDCTLSKKRTGDVRLSEAGSNIGRTFCANCALGSITAGPWRRALPSGGIVAGCNGKCKRKAAEVMAALSGIPRSRVYFFDDQADNVRTFAGSGMNARQVGCYGCGAKAWEVTAQPGVNYCK